MSESDAEKKHEPSDRQWREAAEQGQLARSPDILAAAVVIGAGAAMSVAPEPTVNALAAVLHRVPWTSAPLTHEEIGGWALDVSGLALAAMAVPLGAGALAAALTGFAMTRGEFASSALEPKWERLDPIGTTKEMFFSSRPWVELLKASAKAGLVVWSVSGVIAERIERMPALAATPVTALAGELSDIGMEVLWAAAPALLIIGGADYAWSWWTTRQRLMRTDQELRDEHKATEGDPRIKAQRRQRAREMLRRNGGLRQVRTADVVVTNPTHYAVALRYTRGRDQAPVVVAKGVDELAAMIREEARRHGIPRVEDRPLARGLYARALLGRAIPAEFFGPVAKVLAAVFQRRTARERPPV